MHNIHYSYLFLLERKVLLLSFPTHKTVLSRHKSYSFDVSIIITMRCPNTEMRTWMLCIYCYVVHCASVEKSGFHHEIPDNKEVLHDECYYRGGGGDNVFVCRHVPPPATSRDCHEVMRHDYT